MNLRNNEYEINGESITIRKDVLEKWHEHYIKRRMGTDNEAMRMYYDGKADEVMSMLELFEPLEG